MSSNTKTPTSVKRSITLPADLDTYVETRAKNTAKARGNCAPNYSAALTDIILEARQVEKVKGQ